MPSAIMAPELPKKPTVTLMIDSTKLIAPPMTEIFWPSCLRLLDFNFF
jgi:hypothetical protein